MMVMPGGGMTNSTWPVILAPRIMTMPRASIDARFLSEGSGGGSAASFDRVTILDLARAARGGLAARAGARRMTDGGDGAVSGARAAVAEGDGAASTGFSAFADGAADVAGGSVSGAVPATAGVLGFSAGAAIAEGLFVPCGSVVAAGGCIFGAEPVTSGGTAAVDGRGISVTGGGCDVALDVGAAFGAAAGFSRTGSSGFDPSGELGDERSLDGTSTG
jgi:hypothetical protein